MSTQMASFGYKTAWLAVRDGDLTEVARALGGQVLEPVDWAEGVGKAYQSQDLVLATPLMTGVGAAWLLVAGRWVWTAVQLDHVIPAALSAALNCEVSSVGR
jgi:hypothetical protein